jgi:hypothetical protein
MAQYSEGNVTLVQNSATVLGASCDWLTASAVRVGNLFKKSQENAWYQVTSVNTATNLNITPPYAAVNASATEYLIVRDFTPNYDLVEITAGDLDWNDAYTRTMRIIDNQMYVGTGGGSAQAIYTITSGSGRFGWAVGMTATDNMVSIANASGGSDKLAAIGVIASDLGTTVRVNYTGAVASYTPNDITATSGNRLYLKAWNTTATYNLTPTAPSNASNIVQLIGTNRSATALLLNIQEDYIEL